MGHFIKFHSLESHLSGHVITFIRWKGSYEIPVTPNFFQTFISKLFLFLFNEVNKTYSYEGLINQLPLDKILISQQNNKLSGQHDKFRHSAHASLNEACVEITTSRIIRKETLACTSCALITYDSCFPASLSLPLFFTTFYDLTSDPWMYFSAMATGGDLPVDFLRNSEDIFLFWSQISSGDEEKESHKLRLTDAGWGPHTLVPRVDIQEE